MTDCKVPGMSCEEMECSFGCAYEDIYGPLPTVVRTPVEVTEITKVHHYLVASEKTSQELADILDENSAFNVMIDVEEATAIKMFTQETKGKPVKESKTVYLAIAHMAYEGYSMHETAIFTKKKKAKKFVKKMSKEQPDYDWDWFPMELE